MSLALVVLICFVKSLFHLPTVCFHSHINCSFYYRLCWNRLIVAGIKGKSFAYPLISAAYSQYGPVYITPYINIITVQCRKQREHSHSVILTSRSRLLYFITFPNHNPLMRLYPRCSEGESK